MKKKKKKNIFLNKTTFHYILKIHIKIEKKKHYPVCMTSYKIYILHFSRPLRFTWLILSMQCHTELKVRVNYKQKRICAMLFFCCCFSDFKKLIFVSSYDAKRNKIVLPTQVLFDWWFIDSIFFKIMIQV